MKDTATTLNEMSKNNTFFLLLFKTPLFVSGIRHRRPFYKIASYHHKTNDLWLRIFIFIYIYVFIMCRFKPRAAFAFLCASATIACADIDMCFRCVYALLYTHTHDTMCLRDGAAARCMTHKNLFFYFCSCQHSYIHILYGAIEPYSNWFPKVHFIKI